MRVQAVDPGESGVSLNPDFDFRFHLPTSQTCETQKGH